MGMLLSGYRMLMLMHKKCHVAALGCYICDAGGNVLAVLYSRLRFIQMIVLLRLLRLRVLRNSYPTICYACVTVLLACPSLFVATANSSATNAPMSEASALVHASALGCVCRL